MEKFTWCLRNHFYDKSMLIKEFLDDENKVILVTRPNGCFKFFNIAMLATFFSIELDQNGERYSDKKKSKSYQLFNTPRKCCNKTETLIRFEISNLAEIMHSFQGEIPGVYCDLNSMYYFSKSIRKLIYDTFEFYQKLIKSNIFKK
jgi:hypothetical protein